MYEAHEAATFSCQPVLSCAAPLALAQLVHLSCLDSFSTVLLHVVLGHPSLLFLSGCHSITTMQSSFPSFLSTWPIQFHLLLQISSLIFFMPVMHLSMLSPRGGGDPGHVGHLTSIAFPTVRNLTKNLGPRVGTFVFLARRNETNSHCPHALISVS